MNENKSNNSISKFSKLQALLIENENTYEDLANIVGCSITTIQFKMVGKRKWDWVEMNKIKNHYNLDQDRFISVFNFF